MVDITSKFGEKLKEALASVLPLAIVVLLLCFTVAPVPSGVMLLYLFGAFLLVIGMGLFTLGAEMAMTPIGESVGSHMTKKRNLFLMISVGLVLGTIITVAEPDLQVLAEQVTEVPNSVLIFTIAVGVGVFLVISILRILFRIRLSYMLMAFYVIIFALSFFIPEDFICIAFDSGGVTTGPITVPFIMALGVGIASVRSDKDADSDSFGFVALCSIGPILSVMILSLLYKPESVEYVSAAIPDVSDTSELFLYFRDGLPRFAKEVAIALLPIILFFGIYQIFALKLPKKPIIRISVGLVYTYIGLVAFLTGVNIGFMPVGNYLGQAISALDYNWILIPIGMIIGYFIVAAEPAVHVLNRQVEEVSDGAITQKTMQTTLSIGIAIALGLSMLRILTGISIFYIIIPGYAIALALTFFAPKIFVAIAFDSGGVASGPMTATFLLPFGIGACAGVGGNIFTDAFGLVAMVAMMPLIVIQVLGVIYQIKKKKSSKENIPSGALPEAKEEIITLS